jgi:predicted CDP-diglyceride synthetase/phosphatidate cytidylyltransferase
MASFWREMIDAIDGSLEGKMHWQTPRALVAIPALLFIAIWEIIGHDTAAEEVLRWLLILFVTATVAAYIWRKTLVKRRVRETGSPTKQREAD